MKTCVMLIVFTGMGTPLGHTEGFVESRAEGLVLATPEDRELHPSTRLQKPTGKARFHTFVAVTSAGNWESGRVEFPDIDSYIDVDTPHPGSAETRPDGSSYGSISWRVIGGGGMFKGATGTITGNFTGAADGSFVDHQLFKLFLPD